MINLKNCIMISVVLIAITCTSGCSTIVSDSNYDVRIDSYPRGSDYLITDKKGREVGRGITPDIVSLKAGAGYFQANKFNIDYSKEGYRPSTKVLGTSFDPWYLGNFIFGSWIGFLAVDPLTGAMWSVDEPSVQIMSIGDE
jgi:hypothetical protein